MKKANSTLFFNLLGWMLALALSLSANNVAMSQCAMICNDLVQISLDDDCEVELLPDMILEGNGCPNGVFQVQAKINGSWQPAVGNFVANSAHINLVLQVRVKDLVSGNTCQGNARIEDKLPPELVCADIFLNCAITDYTPAYLLDVLNISEAYPSVDENCTSTTLTYIDSWVDLGCNGSINGFNDVSAYVLRKWTAVDQSGNSSTCNQYLYFERRHSVDVFFPADVVVDCSDPVTDPAITGVPFVTDFGVNFDIWPNGTYCELNATYLDLPLPICDGTYKILRTWTVYDWCRPTGPLNPLTHIQIIKVTDDQGPELECPVDMTVGTNPNDCQLDFDLPDVYVTDNCSRLSSIEAQWQDYNGISHSMYGTFSDFPGNNWWDRDTLAVLGYANNLGIGVTQVKYIIKDNCGNSTVCVFDVTVEDSTPPNVSCDQTTQIALNVDGMALVNASVFDDGTYDNCSPVTFKVRRMNVNDCQDPDPDDLQFHDQVKFCCEDIGDTIQIILRAYDVPVPAGDVDLDFEEWHANDCMVLALVEDKIKPVCQAPNPVTVNCENFDPSLWTYGKAQVSDNCCLDSSKVYQGQIGLSHSVNYALFDTVCNKGTITRTFRSYDCGGNSSSCTQRIVVTYEQNYFIKFPNDAIVTTCDGTGVYGEPFFFGEDCELLGVSFQDEVFTVVPDACFKIERTWQIINWCTYDPNLGCIYVPNPNPNAISNHPTNLPGPTVSAPGTAQPWRSTVVKILPTDPLPGTDYSSFWQKNANCYRYKQIIKIIDGVAPTGTFVTPSCANQNWFTANNGSLWNESYWWDNGLQTHDLCEEPTDLCITGTDACSGSNINIEYLLFLDLDGDGVMETVINSVNVGIAGLGWNNVQYNNLNNPNFSGGTSRAFDERLVPANQKWGFAIQETVNGNNKTACVRWNTQQQQNTFVVPELPHGTHKIKWFLTDGCGNNKEYEYTFTVKDCKAPTVVCLNGLSVNIMPTGMIQMWASDFLQYTEDNCTPNPLKIGIRKCGTGTGFPVDAFGNPIVVVNFTCAELGTQCVELWAIDAAGNADYCETFVIVQDNLGSCGGAPKPVIAGAMKTEMQDGVEEANAVLYGVLPGGAAAPVVSDLTDNAGNFVFADALPVGSNYTIAPEKDDNPLNGVTTYDLVLISKHILGLEPFNSPYKMIAADANKSGSITTFDIVEFRKLILGIYTEMPSNTSWRFVDKGYDFPNALNPFQELFPETKSVQDMQMANLNDDFVGVKIGDVNNSVVPNALVNSDERSVGTLYFDVTDRSVKAGDIVEVKMTAAEKVAGYQFTMNLNGLEVLDVIPGENMGKENFATFADAITASVNAEAGEFAFRFRATKSGLLSQMISLGNSITRTEGYTLTNNDLVNKELALRFNGANGSTLSGAGFELLQNAPNPAKGFTNISFYLPEAAEATLKISNAEGRVVKILNAEFAKGFNTVTLQRADLEAGILFYQLDTPTHSATKKMIVVE